MTTGKWIWTFPAALAVLLLFGLVIWHFAPIRPLCKLNAEDVDSISLFLTPPEQTITLSRDETEQAVSLLRSLTVRHRGYVSEDMAGQTIQITLIKQNGNIIEIRNQGNVTIVIDDVFYRAEYHSAEALNAFANTLR